MPVGLANPEMRCGSQGGRIDDFHAARLRRCSHRRRSSPRDSRQSGPDQSPPKPGSGPHCHPCSSTPASAAAVAVAGVMVPKADARGRRGIVQDARVRHHRLRRVLIDRHRGRPGARSRRAPARRHGLRHECLRQVDQRSVVAAIVGHERQSQAGNHGHAQRIRSAPKRRANRSNCPGRDLADSHGCRRDSKPPAKRCRCPNSSPPPDRGPCRPPRPRAHCPPRSTAPPSSA